MNNALIILRDRVVGQLPGQMDMIYVDIITWEYCRQFRFLTWNSVCSLRGREGVRVGDIVILARCCEFQFIKEHENLV